MILSPGGMPHALVYLAAAASTIRPTHSYIQPIGGCTATNFQRHNVNIQQYIYIYTTYPLYKALRPSSWYIL